MHQILDLGDALSAFTLIAPFGTWGSRKSSVITFCARVAPAGAATTERYTRATPGAGVVPAQCSKA